MTLKGTPQGELRLAQLPLSGRETRRRFRAPQQAPYVGHERASLRFVESRRRGRARAQPGHDVTSAQVGLPRDAR